MPPYPESFPSWIVAIHILERFAIGNATVAARLALTQHFQAFLSHYIYRRAPAQLTRVDTVVATLCVTPCWGASLYAR